MKNDHFDLIVIGAGTAGLTAATIAARLDVKVALVEAERVGGECTWTGCVPSKSLLKAAKVIHEARNGDRYGLISNKIEVDMGAVRDYVHNARDEIYQNETPSELNKQGIEVLLGNAHFLDPHTIQAGEGTLSGERFLLATGAKPVIPSIAGLEQVPYKTYEDIFDNDRLPKRFIIVGAGPTGLEIGQAYQRLGSKVTMIFEQFLPKEEPEAQTAIKSTLTDEGMQLVEGTASRTDQEGDEILVRIDDQEYRGDMLMVSTGRSPNVAGLNLSAAGVENSSAGIAVDERLRTSVEHIYAAGDCVADNLQFSHYASWQAFQATRNALFPGSGTGFSEMVPWATFTDPEVGRIGLTEAQAREAYGDEVQSNRLDLDHADRAVCENDRQGFIKVLHRGGEILGVTIVARRAGETINEFALACQHSLGLDELASTIHVYPTYGSAVQRLAAEATSANLLEGTVGDIARWLAGRF